MIGRPTNTWERVITIDRGSADGIKVEMPVLAAKGLLGQTISVTKHSARVRLITDARSGVAGMIQANRAEGVVRGSIEGAVNLEFVSRETTVRAGDVIITSGMGGVYPKGLLVGEIAGATQTPSSLFQEILVTPSANLAGLEEVVVLTGAPPATQIGGGRVNRLLPTLVALFAAAVLQAALAPYLSIGQVVPNFLLLVVVTIALVEGPAPGAAVGFSAGLIFDLLGSGPVGPMMIVLTLTGYLAGLMHENMFAEGWLLPLTRAGDRLALGRGGLRAHTDPAGLGDSLLVDVPHQDAAGSRLQHGVGAADLSVVGALLAPRQADNHLPAPGVNAPGR